MIMELHRNKSKIAFACRFFAPVLPVLTAMCLGTLQRYMSVPAFEVRGGAAYSLVAPRGMCNASLWFLWLVCPLLKSTESQWRSLSRCVCFALAASASVFFEYQYHSAMLAVAWGGNAIGFVDAFVLSFLTFGSTSIVMAISSVSPVSVRSIAAIVGMSVCVSALRCIPGAGVFLDYAVVGVFFAVAGGRTTTIRVSRS